MQRKQELENMFGLIEIVGHKHRPRERESHRETEPEREKKNGLGSIRFSERLLFSNER